MAVRRDSSEVEGGGKKAGRAVKSRPAIPAGQGHAHELAGLAAFGLSLFLGFVLLFQGKAGLVGRWAEDGLALGLGRLAFLAPLALLAVAGLLMLERRPRLAGRFWGAVMLLLSLLLLVSGGALPFGSGHPDETFVSQVYKTRAGILGEALYAPLAALVGDVGVAITAWILLLAGLSLLTGLTLKRTARETGRAATVVRERAKEGTRRMRSRRGEGPLDPYLEGFGPAENPPRGGWDELAGGQDHDWQDPASAATYARTEVRSAGSPAFDWPSDSSPRGDHPPDEYPREAHPRDVPLVDGEEAFPDLYQGMPVAQPHAPKAHPDSDGAVQLKPRTPRAEDEPASEEHRERGSGHAQTVDEPQPEPTVAASGPSAPPPPRYELPDPDLLKRTAPNRWDDAGGEEETARLLLETLSSFGVEARIIGTVIGPRVTRYELQLAPGTKVSKIAGLKDDLAYGLASTEIRILAPIPGKQAVGVEIPNRRPSFVTLGDIYREFPRSAGPLMVWLGKDISGKAVFTDLTKLPHLLIAGTTGSGKSGSVNCIISSILLRSSPAQVRMILIDPKKVELSPYGRIPHLLVPVVTNMKNAAGVLANVVKEMENRYELMELEKARHLDEMNKSRRRRGEDPLPYIVVVVDELADLMMVAPAEVEDYIIRIAQKARAVGIHLVVATQRPSADVITGLIKANIPSRIAFAVSSQVDSRVILDANGAETLLGMGDMLFRPLGSNKLQRVQGAYITEGEISGLVRHVRGQAEPQFREELLLPLPEEHEEEEFDPDEDDLLADAAELVLDTGTASVSMLQRRLRVGYTRAGRLIDMLERRGIVGPHEGSKARQIQTSPERRQEVLASLRADSRGEVPEPEADPSLFDDE